MKKTGVFRRIDELGRIVVPKEIRENLHIKSGDSLEIFLEDDGIVLKKFFLLDNFNEISNDVVNMIGFLTKKTVFLFSGDKILSSYGKDDNKESFAFSLAESDMKTTEGRKDDFFYALFPIVLNGNKEGCLILISSLKINENEIFLLRGMSIFLSKMLKS